MRRHFFTRRKRHLPVFLLAILITIGVHLTVRYSGNHAMIRKGEMTVGHEKLVCNECHRPAPGSFRQQVQASFRHAIGQRETPAEILTEKVTMDVCNDCHIRPEDRHPASRFLEPRFAEARENIQPHDCLSCHREHKGARFTLDKTGNGYCKNCHSETEVADDPLDIPHSELIRTGKWETCLQCHDFHGSHTFDLPDQMKDTFPLESVLDYLRSGRSPYGAEKLQKAPEVFFTKRVKSTF